MKQFFATFRFSALICLVALPSSFADESETTVLYCKAFLHDIPKYAITAYLENDSKEVGLRIFSPGKRLGVLNLNGTTLRKLADDAAKHDQSMDPFFGKGHHLILHSKGEYYVLYLEKDPRNPNMNGIRCGIGALVTLGESRDVMTGSSYDGVIFDSKILAQLNAIVDGDAYKAEKKNEESRESKGK